MKRDTPKSLDINFEFSSLFAKALPLRNQIPIDAIARANDDVGAGSSVF